MHPSSRGTTRSRDLRYRHLQVGEEVRVLVAEGLRPADLIQGLLTLR